MPRGKFDFSYGMKKAFEPGNYPRREFIRREDDPDGKYSSVLVYGRRLTDREQVKYQLDDLNNKDVRALTRLREIAGIRQRELAAKTGIPFRQIQRLEYTGMKGCAIETAIKLADALKCDVRDFVDWED